MVHDETLVIARTIREVRAVVGDWRAHGFSVGLVPTMGSLHDGHLALIARARADNDRVLATVFVNPLQFGPSEDFDAYPRDDERDFALLRDRRCDAVFAPGLREMLPAGGPGDVAATRVSVTGLADVLCGRSRPGHFDGVATIVTKLLMITQPDSACFGEKDYQQLTIIRRLVGDLNVPVRISGVATVREADGLALSSRNVYLDADQRKAAPALHQALQLVRARLLDAAADFAAELDAGRAALRAAGFDRVDYFTLAAGDTLETLTALHPGARLFGAAVLGRTRLIDNIPAAHFPEAVK
jgi:pantoate--beta-alanine ligase